MRRRLPFWPSVVCIWIMTSADLAKADAWLPGQVVPDPAHPGRSVAVAGSSPVAAVPPAVGTSAGAPADGGGFAGTAAGGAFFLGGLSNWKGTPPGYVLPATVLSSWRGWGDRPLPLTALTRWAGSEGPAEDGSSGESSGGGGSNPVTPPPNTDAVPGPLGVLVLPGAWLWCRRLRLCLAAAGLNRNPDR